MPPAIGIVAAAVATGLTAAGAAGVGVLGATILGGTLTVGAALGIAVGVLGQVASSLLQRRRTSRRQTSIDPITSSREAQQALREPATVRMMSFGRVKLAIRSHPVYDSPADGFFYRFGAVNHGLVHNFVAHELNGEAVTLDASGRVTSSTDGKWNNQVIIETNSGIFNQSANARLLANYPPWTADHRALGVATVLITQIPVAADASNAADVHTELAWRGIVDAAADVYDPRTETTGFSDNAALVYLWYLTHPDGRDLPLSKVDLDAFRVAADACDLPIALAAGGTEPQYRAAGSIQLDESPNDVLRRMLINMDAAPTWDTQGRHGIRIGNAPVTDLLTFTDDMMFETEFRSGKSASDHRNTLTAVMTSPDHRFQEITVGPFTDQASIDTAGRKPDVLDLPFCPSKTQADRLLKLELLSRSPVLVGSITVDLSGISAFPGTTIRLSYENAETTLPLRVTSRERLDTGRIRLEVRTIDPREGQWDPSEESVPSAATNLAPVSSLLTAPTGMTLSPVAVAVNQSTTGVSARI
ncbi:MAG: hypothetical protein AAFP68_19715, partial [Pseudomonadota bacterium]